MLRPNEQNEIRKKLRYSWVSFFGRFGSLTPAQIETIPKILEGRNVIVASPTATGKTEAVMAPVAEQLFLSKDNSLGILYLVPTRALANDALIRLQGPLLDLGMKTAIKHGDKPSLPAGPLQCLITTPESLDSLLCRKHSIFRKLKAVVLDEIHLIDGTYRGDQTIVLVRRLRKIKPDGFAVHLLSATFSDPSEIARRYVEHFDVVTVPGQRPIENHFANSTEIALELARKNKWMKVLCFCNKRASVETLTKQLQGIWGNYPVVCHHGSLSKALRNEAETVMKESRVAICVATSTLEIGIDIGDIDLIILNEVPWSVSSLLQRVGRGNRRTGTTRVASVVGSLAEKQVVETMLKIAQSGALPKSPYSPDKSVAAQQMLSITCEKPDGILTEEFEGLLAPLCTTEETKTILWQLNKLGWIELQRAKYFPTTKLMDLCEKGALHSNIPDSTSYQIADEYGKPIGTISGQFDEVFAMGGNAWKVVAVQGSKVIVRPNAGPGSTSHFVSYQTSGAFNYLLPPALRK